MSTPSQPFNAFKIRVVFGKEPAYSVKVYGYSHGFVKITNRVAVTFTGRVAATIASRFAVTGNFTYG